MDEYQAASFSLAWNSIGQINRVVEDIIRLSSNMSSVVRNLYSLFCAALLLLSFSIKAPAEDTSYQKLKAAYLVNIARFVNWPAMESGNSVTLCLPAASDLHAMRALLDGQPVGNDRTLNVISPVADITTCNILYLDGALANHTAFTDAENSERTLVVAELPNAWERGFAIQMYTRDLKLRLAINEEIVKNASYEMSSKLLRLYRRLN